MIKTIFPKEVFAVQRKLDQIIQGDSYALQLTKHKQIHNWLNRMATRHSSDIEHPDSTRVSKRKLKQIKENSLQRNYRAWLYTKEYVESGKELNPFFIHNILTMLEPNQELSKITGFRTCDIQVTDSKAYRPSPGKISKEIHKMKFAILQMNTALEKAIFSHYHIARIHPGEDGNGRLSRIVQNAFLHDSNYFPIIIPSDERETYISLMEETHTKFYKNNPEYLIEFSQYLAGKLDESIDLYASYGMDVTEPINIKPKKLKSKPKKSTSHNRVMRNQKTNYRR